MSNALGWAGENWPTCLPVTLIFFGIYSLFVTPVPGLAVAVIGVGSVIMSIQPNLTPIGKAVWVMAIFLLLFISSVPTFSRQEFVS